ncbi:hypothetical protein UA08_02487 [Talaromyces atroroseus]|uniref:Uncharacterized protein n=1 Tax=Talaromyces atroroseus TaxID=1441469 RepID=A0A225B3G0_TALAT|nr:hypothetical protein UA08_02487 [Talaromyces atroroseus]OKL61826.1 hypothetical protein UA08_02487 [Talaromyces atroroseus]
MKTMTMDIKASSPFPSQRFNNSARKRTQHHIHLLFKLLLFLGIAALNRLGITTAGLGVGVLGDLVLISTVVQVTKTLPPGVPAPTLTEGDAADPTGSPSSEQQQQQQQHQAEPPQQTAPGVTSAEAEAIATAASESNSLSSFHSTFSTAAATTLSGTATATATTAAIQGSDSSKALGLHKLPTYAIVAIACSAIAFIAILAITFLCLVRRRRRSRNADMAGLKRRGAIKKGDGSSDLDSLRGRSFGRPKSFSYAEKRDIPSRPSPGSEQVRFSMGAPAQVWPSDPTRRGSLKPGLYQQSGNQGRGLPRTEIPRNLESVMTPVERGIGPLQIEKVRFPGTPMESDEKVHEFLNGDITSNDSSSIYSKSVGGRYSAISTITNLEKTVQGSKRLTRDDAAKIVLEKTVQDIKRSTRIEDYGTVQKGKKKSVTIVTPEYHSQHNWLKAEYCSQDDRLTPEDYSRNGWL